ncbi:hypothetical protein [Winogradskya humida]|uniref:Uncharacterized protein n=1 Tax=Winogradskya humida TaxID=113566 RepID=A0ABQ4A0E1_9ACTN|nr:hypothetical protein [Actinoplanes humidus]GIE24312.1 hypothetical protein Ahu01nite_074140 [Actinoplanes humidus]
MKLFRRRPKLPADRTPALEPDERVLCWAPSADDAVLVATNRGLWLPDGTRLGWHEIHKAAWSGRELMVTPAEIAQQRNGYVVLVDAPVIGFLLLEPGELPDQVRARVTRSVAYTSHHPLPPEGGVRVVGRRVSGVDGLTWSVRYDAKTAVDADPIVEVTDELVASAQDATTPPA